MFERLAAHERPVDQALDSWAKRYSHGTESILYLGRHLGIDLPCDDAVLFQLLELLDQHFLIHALHPALQFGKRSGCLAANSWKMMTIFHFPSSTRSASPVAAAHTSCCFGSSHRQSRTATSLTCVALHGHLVQIYVLHRLGSRAVGHACDIASKFVLLMTLSSQRWPSRWRHRHDHAVRGISVIDAVTAVTLCMSGACVAAAIRSTSIRSR